jgi:hypothetical protein
MATEKNVWLHTRSAAADLSACQYHAVKINTSDAVALCSTAGEVSLGLLQNEPTLGQNADIAFAGIGKGILGGTVTYMDPLTSDASGHLIKANDNDENVIGRALKSGVATAIVPVLIIPSAGLSAGVTPQQETYVAAANYATTGQYLAVKAHTVAGQVVKCSSAGERILGILQNAPASSGEAEVCTYGECTAYAGSGGVAAGDSLAIDANGKVVTATGTAQVIGWAVAAILESASGTIFVAPIGMYSVDGATLTSTKFWVGNGSNLAVAVNMSGDATLANTGAVTVTDISTTAAGDAAGDLIYRDAADTFERLAKGTAAQILAMNGAATAPEWIAQSAMTVGNATNAATAAVATNVTTTAAGDAAGDLIYRDAAATLQRLAAGAAGAVLQQNVGATAPQWSTISADVTIADGGAVTIGAKKVAASKLYSAAQGCIFRTDAANVVSELSLADGKIAVGNGTDVAALQVKAAGTMVHGNGTTLTTLAIGSKGSKLSVNGPGSAPTWGPDKCVYEDFSAYAATDQVANMLATGVAFAGTADALHHCYTPAGNVFCFEALGAGQTLEPVLTADGLNMAGDQTNDEGYEIYSNFLGASGHPFRIGEAAFYFLCKFFVTDGTGTDDLQVGFRRAEICRPNFDDYVDAATLGVNTAAAPLAIKIATINDGAATTETDTNQTLASATAVQFKILVDAAGAVTYQHDIVAPGTLAAPVATAAFSFDAGDPVIPFFRVLQVVAPGTGAVPILLWEVGYQA